MKRLLQEENIGRSRAPTLVEQRGMEDASSQDLLGQDAPEKAPDFGGGVDYHDQDTPRRERLPDDSRESPPTTQTEQNTPRRSEP